MKKAYGIFGVVILLAFAAFLLIENMPNEKQVNASNHDITKRNNIEIRNPVSEEEPVKLDRQEEMEEMAKNNPNILPAPEYYSVEEFFASYIELLNRENKESVEHTDKYSYELHVVTSAQIYAKHFLELTENSTEQTKLNKIIDVTNEVLEKMGEENLAEYSLETVFNELRTVMSNF